MQLTDQVAIITGSARGIGRATAVGTAREGARIVVADINAAGAQEAAAELAALGQQAIAVQTDVADQEQVQAMVQRAIEAFGRIDILVNNAGNAVLSPLLETTAAVWDRTLKIRLYGTFFCTQAVVPHMVAQSLPLQSCKLFFGIVITRIWVDPKHDIDLVTCDFHPLDQRPDQVALARPVGSLQAIVEFRREVFQTANNQLQLPVQSGLIRQGLALRLQTGEALAQAGDPGLKLRLVNEAIRIDVDQLGDALPQLADLGCDGG